MPGSGRVWLHPTNVTDILPTEYRADAVVVMGEPNNPVLAVVVEVQLRRDRRKRLSWPVYLATLRARLECPVMLLVLSTDARTSAWCGAPIDMGHPGWVLRPFVVGPEQVPAVTDPRRAMASPELAVLSAVAHPTHPERDQLLTALVAGLRTIEEKQATLYADVVCAALPETARKYLESLMATRAYEYQSEFVSKFVRQGRVEGEAEAVLAVLDARGFDVPDGVRDRITGCSDLDQLSRWVRRAAVVDSLEDLFD